MEDSIKHEFGVGDRVTWGSRFTSYIIDYIEERSARMKPGSGIRMDDGAQVVGDDGPWAFTNELILVEPAAPPTRYFLAHDNSGHDYVVPVERKEEWFAWLEIPEDDERSWDVPEYARQVDGRLTFTDPRDD